MLYEIRNENIWRKCVLIS